MGQWLGVGKSGKVQCEGVLVSGVDTPFHDLCGDGNNNVRSKQYIEAGPNLLLFTGFRCEHTNRAYTPGWLL